MVKLLFFHFRVTNSNLKNIKLHYELLSQSRLMLEIQFYLCAVPLQDHQEKTSLFFWSPTKKVIVRSKSVIVLSFCFLS